MGPLRRRLKRGIVPGLEKAADFRPAPFLPRQFDRCGLAAGTIRRVTNRRSVQVNRIIYLVGLVVVVVIILSLLGVV